MAGVNDPRLDNYFDPTSIQPLPFLTDENTGSKADIVYEAGENTILFYPLGGGEYNEVFMEGPFTIPASDSAAGIMTWRPHRCLPAMS